MKYIIIFIIVIIAGYFGYSYYQNNNNSKVKIFVENSIVQNPQTTDRNVKLNNEYKAHIYDVNVQNNSESIFILYPYENFRLKSGSSYYQVTSDAAVEDELQIAELQIGQEASGQISFHAPKNRNAELQFRLDESSEWQKI